MRNLISDVKARLLAGSGERRLKIGFVGCGEHARTNLYPVLPGLRVDLMAICARRLERAQRAARDFGASAAYDDFQEMFTKEPLDAVIICVNARETPPAAIAARPLKRRSP